MRAPTEYEIENLLHYNVGYDPIAAKKYYEEHKQLKGRRPGAIQPPTSSRRPSAGDSRTGKTRDQIAKDARTHQRQELTARIGSLSKKLVKLEALIKEKESAAKSTSTKSTAKKERAVKEKDKPKTAAEKAQAARDAKKYADSHKQELKTKAKADDKKSGGSSGSKKKASGTTTSVSELRSLATKVRGLISVAKQKLAAL